MNPDQVNASFEGISAILTLINVRELYKDRMVKGISLIPQFVFICWGIWNIYYYYHLSQPWSWYTAMLMTSVNLWWTVLAIRFKFYPERKVLDIPPLFI